jgi:hypothetical protein
MPVMHLDDLDVVVRTEDRRDAAGQAEQQVDADAHVGGHHHRHAPGGLRQGLAVLGAEPGGADDQRRGVFLGVAGILEDRGGDGEVDNDIGGGEQQRRIVADVNAGGLDPGKRADVAADCRMTGPLDPSGKAGAGRLQHCLHQHPAHSPGAAGNPDPHGFPP